VGTGVTGECVELNWREQHGVHKTA